MDDEHSKIEINSEELLDILGKAPSRILRFGITFIFGLVLIIIGGCFLFTYPDVITGPIEISIRTSPTLVVSKSIGIIDHIMVSDSQYVNSGQFLASIKDSTDLDQIIELESVVYNIEKQNCKLISIRKLPLNITFGPIMNSYSTLINTIIEYQKFSNQNFNNSKIDLLNKKIFELHKYMELLGKQTEIYEKEYLNKMEIYKRDSLSYYDTDPSKFDIEKSKNGLLLLKLECEKTSLEHEKVILQIQEIHQDIHELSIEQNHEEDKYISNIQELINILKNQIITWKKSHLIQAHCNGTVVFSKSLYVNHNVSKGDTIFKIFPDTTRQYIGRIHFSNNELEKIKIGQLVTIKLNDYPYDEYGILVGKISNKVIMEDVCVEVALTKDLITSLNYKLPLESKCFGVASIVTANIPLISRLISPFKHTMKD